ncbi:collagenase [Streptomyces sp. NPDC020965]|uniref:collagenase n=1 Tax=Streptomyces sp. NPDC020965 TaxID=3365105 RepID=UPI0037A966F0
MRTQSDRRSPTGLLIATLALCLGLVLPAPPSHATSVAPATPAGARVPDGPAPAAALLGGPEAEHIGGAPLAAADRPPLALDTAALKDDYDTPATAPARVRPSMKGATARTATAPCSVGDFTGKTGAALVQQIKSSATDCVNTLFQLTGADAHGAFREAQMTTVAQALRDGSAAYPGDNSTSMAQVVLYLRAGYYVQWSHADAVGEYGPTLRTAIRSGLDAFFAGPRAYDVNDANGEVLAETVTLIDSAQDNARHLPVVKRLLNDYTSSWNSSWWMLNAVNNVYTVLFRGHGAPGFVQAVQLDPAVLDTLHRFASTHLAMLGSQRSHLVSNAGLELGRFLRHPGFRAKVTPLAVDLLGRTAVTGPTAPLWVAVAGMTWAYDKANCATYRTCDLPDTVKTAVLKVRHTCGPSIRIVAQQMTTEQLDATCASLRGQDAHFHALARDAGPVADDNNTTIEVVAFDSSADYQTYAGVVYGIDTNNGGMYLEGDPARAGNQPRFIAYEAEWLRPEFHIWNLNHEYTHYLDGRFTMYGDFAANMSTPTVWWVEGFAEYVSYSYRDVVYTAAIEQAGRHTYALRTLFDTTYDNANSARVYNWGYLAVRYMLQSHRADMDVVLGHYRTGNWAAARDHLVRVVGNGYESDWKAWLTACAYGACGGTNPPVNQAPVAAFTTTVSGPNVTFADRSTDRDGTVVSRVWDFGDGTTSTATDPIRTYAVPGTYTVRLTVTDDKGATGTTTRTVEIPGALPECSGPDRRSLGENCQRSRQSAASRDYAYLYLQVPAGTERLTITSAGGSGDADLYYSRSGWATTANHTARSTGAGNGHTLTIENPAAGTHYISLHGVSRFDGVTVATRY